MSVQTAICQSSDQAFLRRLFRITVIVVFCQVSPRPPGMAEVEEAPIGQRVAELENTVGWLTARSYRQEERVDRIYAQQRVFTINSVALEEVWTGLG